MAAPTARPADQTEHPADQTDTGNRLVNTVLHDMQNLAERNIEAWFHLVRVYDQSMWQSFRIYQDLCNRNINELLKHTSDMLKERERYRT